MFASKRKLLGSEDLAAIVHDLRAPLRGILLHAQMYRENADEQHLVTLTQRAQQMDGMLLALGSLSTVAPRNLAATPLHEIAVAAGASNPNRPVVQVRGHALAWCDPERVTSILAEVYANAVHHGGVDTVDVDLSESGRLVHVCIANDGLPIQASLAESIYDPFVTTDSARHGLGLTTVRAMAQMMGGDLVLDAADPVRFVLTLPHALRNDSVEHYTSD